MSLIFSSFSQNYDRPLEGMGQELPELIKYFKKKIKEGKLDYVFESGKTVEELTHSLINEQKDLRIFHFSGHSSGEELDFNGADFSKTHVARFFNGLTAGNGKLQCVFLNGCENEEIVKLLDRVPVVIGTKKAVSNYDAIRFTKDFFAALIEGEKSYEVAYKQARDNRPDHDEGKNNGIIRGSGSSEELEDTGAYFMRINDPNVAAAKFPLTRPPVAKWPWLIVGLLALFVGGWFLVNSDFVQKKLFGYICPDFIDDDKANVLILDERKDERTVAISLAINENEILRKHINTAYISDSQELISDNKYSISDIKEKCDFEYYLKISLINNDSILSYTLTPELSKPKVFGKTFIGDLSTLTTGIEKIEDVESDSLFFLTEFSVTFSQNNAEIAEYAFDEVEKLKFKPKMKLRFQRLSVSLAKIFKANKNYGKMLAALENGAAIDTNDWALACREELINFNEEQGNYASAFGQISSYISSLSGRVENPSAYMKLESMEKYENGIPIFQLRRANLAYHHLPLDLNANRIALKDFRTLRDQSGDPNLYKKEIEEILERLKVPADQIVKLAFKGISKKELKEAAITYDGDQMSLDEDEMIIIDCRDKSCFQKNVEVSHKNYETALFTIPGYGNFDMTLEQQQKPISKRKVCFNITNSNGKPLGGAVIRMDRKKYFTDRKGKGCIPCENKTCLNKKYSFLLRGYDPSFFTPRAIGEYTIKMYRPGENIVQEETDPEPLKPTEVEPEIPPVAERIVCLNVVNEYGGKVNNVEVLYNGKALQLKDERYCMDCRNNSCIGKKISIDHPDYINQNYVIKNNSINKVTLKKKPVVEEEDAYVFSMYITDENDRAINDAKITAGRTYKEKTNDQGLFTVDLKAIGRANSRTVKIEAKGFETKLVSYEKLKAEQKISLSKQQEENYVISGRVYDCEGRSTLENDISINGSTVVLDKGKNYSTTISGNSGKTIVIIPPSGFLLKNRTDYGLILGSNKDINKDFYLQGRDKEYVLSGIVVSGDKRLNFGNVQIKNKPNNQAKILDDGTFRLVVSDCFCDELVVNVEGYTTKTIDLRRYVKAKKDTKINLGLIDLGRPNIR